MSASMIEIAQRKAAALGLSKLCEFETADFMKKFLRSDLILLLPVGYLTIYMSQKPFCLKFATSLMTGL